MFISTLIYWKKLDPKTTDNLQLLEKQNFSYIFSTLFSVCSSPGDSRRLTIENLFYADLRNAFLYRVMAKAESVDISFPMRYNLQGNKQMYGYVVSA